MSYNFQPKVARAKNALSECKRNFEELISKDEARAVAAVSTILEDVTAAQVLASHVIMDAERFIVKQNPRQRWWKRKEPRTAPNIVAAGKLRKMRRIHDRISDKAYLKLKEYSLKKNIPLTHEYVLQQIQQGDAAVLGATTAATTAVIAGGV